MLRALVLVLLLSVLALPAFGTTYYLDRRNGDDALGGKTPATAWKNSQIMALNGSHHNIITDNELYATKRDWVGAGVNAPRGTDSSVISKGDCISRNCRIERNLVVSNAQPWYGENAWALVFDTYHLEMPARCGPRRTDP